jgi:hypothetical protein
MLILILKVKFVTILIHIFAIEIKLDTPKTLLSQILTFEKKKKTKKQIKNLISVLFIYIKAS